MTEELPTTFPPIEHSMARYQAACHGMQTGVMMLMEGKGASKETDPKHLRVGVNSAMVECSALVHILIARGVIIEAEWYDALATAMEAERDAYTKQVEQHLGCKVELA